MIYTKQPYKTPKLIHCKDCIHRGEDECPMRHVESYYNYSWEEWDEIVYDRTEDDGYCDRAVTCVEDIA